MHCSRRKVDEKTYVTFLLCDPAAGTSNELDVRNKWEENTDAHMYNDVFGLRGQDYSNIIIEEIKSIAAVISMEAGVEYFLVASILGIFNIQYSIQYRL